MSCKFKNVKILQPNRLGYISTIGSKRRLSSPDIEQQNKRIRINQQFYGYKNGTYKEFNPKRYKWCKNCTGKLDIHRCEECINKSIIPRMRNPKSFHGLIINPKPTDRVRPILSFQSICRNNLAKDIVCGIPVLINLAIKRSFTIIIDIDYIAGKKITTFNKKKFGDYRRGGGGNNIEDLLIASKLDRTYTCYEMNRCYRNFLIWGEIDAIQSDGKPIELKSSITSNKRKPLHFSKILQAYYQGASSILHYKLCKFNEKIIMDKYQHINIKNFISNYDFEIELDKNLQILLNKSMNLNVGRYEIKFDFINEPQIEKVMKPNEENKEIKDEILEYICPLLGKENRKTLESIFSKYKISNKQILEIIDWTNGKIKSAKKDKYSLRRWINLCKKLIDLHNVLI